MLQDPLFPTTRGSCLVAVHRRQRLPTHSLLSGPCVVLQPLSAPGGERRELECVETSIHMCESSTPSSPSPVPMAQLGE